MEFIRMERRQESKRHLKILQGCQPSEGWQP